MEPPITCPYCHRSDRQLKVGRNRSGTARFLCAFCQRKYTPAPRPRGYADDLRRQAIRLYLDGMNLRRIGRTLGVVHQTVANWVNAYASTLPDEPPLPERPHTSAGTSEPFPVIEFDELYTFEGEKTPDSTC